MWKVREHRKRRPRPVGAGGSLSGRIAGAANELMGQAGGHYTFFGHLRWTPAIALGYALSIWVHFLVNGRLAGVAVG